MGGLGTLFGFAVLGGIFIAAAAVFWFALKAILFIVLLPVRLVIWLIALPLLLLKVILLSVAGVLAGVLFAVGIGVAAVGFVTLLLPLLLIGLLGWGLFRVVTGPATA
jgi:hypothetical protein